MGLLKKLLRQTEKIDFLFPNSFEELMNDEYYDYDKFEWFLYYVFKLDGSKVDKIGKRGRGDGGADLILTIPQSEGGIRRIGVQAKYWKNRVGTEPINQLASAQARHNLTDLWIITTSDLTNDAKQIAESMDIKILRADDVAELITSIKERHKIDIEKNGSSSIEFLKPTKKQTSEKKLKTTKGTVMPNNEHVKLLKQLRGEISKKYELSPVYNVFVNETLFAILEHKPETLEELAKIKGLGAKKIAIFGPDIVEFVKNTLVEKKVGLEVDQKLKDLLLKERIKIARFNKMSENDVFDDWVADNLSKMKPRNKEVLGKVYGFKKENIDIFGDYLLKVIVKYTETNN